MNLLIVATATLWFVVLTLPSATAASQLKDIYNIVVLGNTGVGKSSLLNMFAGQDSLFAVGNNVVSETQIASSRVHRVFGKPDGVQLRLVDTQGLSDTGGDLTDIAHIKNMVEYIKELGHIDLFIICFDGTNPRFTSYAKSTISLFSDIFPDFLNHTVIVFNKWSTPDMQRQINLRREYQTRIREDYGMAQIPCYFIDSFFNRKMLRDNDDGTEAVRYLHRSIQERTYAQLLELMHFMVHKESTCDVRAITPKDTERTALAKNKEAALKELHNERAEFEQSKEQMLKEQNDKRVAQENQQLRSAFGHLLDGFVPFVPIMPVLTRIFGK